MKEDDRDVQLAILTDALTRIIETASLSSASAAPASDFLEHNSEVAAQALIAAATFGPLPGSAAH